MLFLYTVLKCCFYTQLIEGLTGERAIFKRRGEKHPEVRKSFSNFTLHVNFYPCTQLLLDHYLSFTSLVLLNYYLNVLDWLLMLVGVCTGLMV